MGGRHEAACGGAEPRIAAATTVLKGMIMQADNEREDMPGQGAEPASPPRLNNPSRRRFARGGAAAGAVLGSLASKPVLGTTSTYWCTVSGKLSGNLSNHTDVSFNCKSLGWAPSGWKTKTWPDGFMKGTLPNKFCSFSGGAAGTSFNGYTADGRTLLAAFKMVSQGSPSTAVCAIVDAKNPTAFSTGTANATMLQVLETGGALNDTAIGPLGRATIASLLNAKTYGGANGDYPLTQGQIIDMFNAVYLGGLYKVPKYNVEWSAAQVQNYFESLYGAM
jgi:hypothetical protein